MEISKQDICLGFAIIFILGMVTAVALLKFGGFI